MNEESPDFRDSAHSSYTMPTTQILLKRLNYESIMRLKSEFFQCLTFRLWDALLADTVSKYALCFPQQDAGEQPREWLLRRGGDLLAPTICWLEVLLRWFPHWSLHSLLHQSTWKTGVTVVCDRPKDACVRFWGGTSPTMTNFKSPMT